MTINTGALRRMSPCERAIYQGEVRCPVKLHTVIAIGACVSYQGVREGASCREAKCQFTLHRDAFALEMRKAVGEGEGAEQRRNKTPRRKKCLPILSTPPSTS